MAVRHSTRARAGSSLSTSPTLVEDLFDLLQRRLLVAVNHVRLVSQHFGDLSSFSREDAPAGLTLYEAAQELDHLYNDIDSWYVRHEHSAKVRQPVLGDAGQEGERTDGVGHKRVIDDAFDSIYDRLSEGLLNLRTELDVLGAVPATAPSLAALGGQLRAVESARDELGHWLDAAVGRDRPADPEVRS